MKYKVGQKVIIRDDLIVGKAYGMAEFVVEMQAYEGDEVTIIEAKEFNKHLSDYKIKEDEGQYVWSNKMLKRKLF